MRRLIMFVLLLAVVLAGLTVSRSTNAQAATGDHLALLAGGSFTAPGANGNGRAVLYHGGVIYYTVYDSTGNIYEAAPDGTCLGVLPSGVPFASLTWDSNNNTMWAGAYDGTGNIYTVDPVSGAATFQFSTLTATTGDGSSYDGYVDGLAYDPATDSLWMSNDLANSGTQGIFRFSLTGTLVQQFLVDASTGGNSGIAINGGVLKLAFPNTPEIRTYSTAWSNNALATPQATLSTGTSATEGMSFDSQSFAPNCAVWTNSAGPGDITAYEVPCAEPALATNTYVAIGDSYSAGEGMNNYFPGTDTSDNHCHRSPLGYPLLADAARSLGTTDFVACSGAITDDLFNPNNNGNINDTTHTREAPQLNALSAATQTVTLTLGGNDVGFSSVLAQCIIGRVGVKKVFGKAGCSKNALLTSAVNSRMQALSGNGTATTPTGVSVHSYSSILQRIHALAPNARIFVGDYPAFFAPFKGECGVGSVDVSNIPVIGTATAALKITKADAQWLNSLAAVMDLAMYTAAGANNATFVDVGSNFATHQLCGTGTPWIQSFSGTADFKTKQLTSEYSGSFHPSTDGQLSGYESAFVTLGL
jgi:hypothetical protein